MYQQIGLAVFSGAATTFIAVTFLYFTQVYVLFKFAIMMQVTLGFAIIYALVILPAALSAMGPQGGTGQVSLMLQRALSRCRAKTM